jgi:CubicO group peptidase (beta-lactamase class C family)
VALLRASSTGKKYDEEIRRRITTELGFDGTRFALSSKAEAFEDLEERGATEERGLRLSFVHPQRGRITTKKERRASSAFLFGVLLRRGLAALAPGTLFCILRFAGIFRFS